MPVHDEQNNTLQSIDWQAVKEKRKQMMIDELAEKQNATQILKINALHKAEVDEKFLSTDEFKQTWETIPSKTVLERIEKAISLLDAHKFYFEALGYNFETIDELLEALQIAKRTCDFAQVTDFVKP